MIYGTALLSICLIAGLFLGRLIGKAMGIDADIGGVGIAMILLILACDGLRRYARLDAATQNGIAFWGQMYVPIVVAMAASQNVAGALNGGVMAAFAGLATVAICFVLVGVLVRLAKDEE